MSDEPYKPPGQDPDRSMVPWVVLILFAVVLVLIAVRVLIGPVGPYFRMTSITTSDFRA